jgi:hypothetical protein
VSLGSVEVPACNLLWIQILQETSLFTAIRDWLRQVISLFWKKPLTLT